MNQERLTSVIGRVTDENGNQHNVYGIGMLRDKVAKEEPSPVLCHKVIEYTLSKKLGQYEDADEELEIDWITLSKARKLVWYKIEVTEYEGGANSWNELDSHTFICKSIVTRVDFKNKTVYIQGAKKWFPLSEFGDTWALTKEELE